MKRHGQSHKKPAGKLDGQEAGGLMVLFSLPASWYASDKTWSVLSDQYVGAWFLLSVRSELQPLAKKYGDKPREYERALRRLVRQTEKRLGIPESVPRALDDPFRPAQRLSKRQLKGFIVMRDFLQSLVSQDGEPKAPADSDARMLMQGFKLLASKPTGTQPRPITKEIRYLYYERGLKGHAAIASLVFSTYRTASPIEKRDMREQVREAIRRHNDAK